MTRHSRNRADAKPTWTKLVLDALVDMDDFVTATELRILTGGNVGQVTAALAHLRAMHAVSAESVDGVLYWFATPGEDERTRQLDERVPEDRPRKPRRARVVKVPQK